MQEDPIGFSAGDHNVYRYVWNNPLNWVDPSGLTAEYGGVAGPITVALISGVMAKAAIDFVTAESTAAYLRGSNLNALSSISGEIVCTFFALSDALFVGGQENTKVTGVDLDNCRAVAMSVPSDDAPTIYPPDAEAGHGCRCNCRAGGRNKKDKWDWQFVQDVAQTCPIAAKKACASAVGYLKKGFGHIHHAQAWCSDGQKYNAGGGRI